MSVEIPDAVDASALPQIPKIELWSPERMREGLLSDDPALRVHALAMTIQPDAELDQVVSSVITCIDSSRSDATACQLGAVALGMVKRESEKPAAVDCLATLITADNAPAVRTFAAHGLAQHARVPAPAWPGLAQMLFNDDGPMRQVALRAATPFAVVGAAFIAQAAAGATPTKWTNEGLAALALSAGNSSDGKQRVEAYVLRSLQGQPLLPCGIAGYSALARLNPDGVAPVALAKIAAADDDATALAAISALAQMGETGKSAIPGLIEALRQTGNGEREEAICRALLPMKVRAGDIPLPHILKRIEIGADRAVAAHCLLLSLHAKAFASASKAVAVRYAVAGAALQRVLDEVHYQLVGKRLTPAAAPAAAPKTN